MGSDLPPLLLDWAGEVDSIQVADYTGAVAVPMVVVDWDIEGRMVEVVLPFAG